MSSFKIHGEKGKHEELEKFRAYANVAINIKLNIGARVDDAGFNFTFRFLVFLLFIYVLYLAFAVAPILPVDPNCLP